MTEELARVLIVGLAGWRLAALLTIEDGPWDLLARFRRLVGVPVLDLGGPPIDEPEPGVLGKLFSCAWCLSPWVSLIFWGLWEVHWAIPGITAASAVVVITDRWR